MIPYYEMRNKIDFFVNLAGIKKKVTLHTFRHSRITHLVKKGVNENIIKKMMWGDIGTNMFDTYVHLSDDDISEITDEHYGIENCIEEKKPKKLDTFTIRVCPRCKIIHSPKDKYCGQCGSILPEVEIEKEVYMELKKIYYESYKYKW
jgi:hypothetical protein